MAIGPIHIILEARQPRELGQPVNAVIKMLLRTIYINEVMIPNPTNLEPLAYNIPLGGIHFEMKM